MKKQKELKWQGFTLINLSKKEYVDPFFLADNSELEEIGLKSSFAAALKMLVLSAWKGDNIVLAGNLCKDDSSNESICKTAYKTYSVVDAFTRNASDSFSPRNKSVCEAYKAMMSDVKAYDDYRFLCNEKLKCYVDISNLPKDKEGKSYDPLTLLIAVGNGLGKRDYRGNNENLVGSWAETSSSISFEKEIPSGYSEFKPNFKTNSKFQMALKKLSKAF